MDTYNVYMLSLKEKSRYFICTGALAALVGWLFYKNVAIAVLMALTPLLLIKKYGSWMLSKRREEMNAQFKDVLYAFSDSAAAGKQAGDSVAAAWKNLKRIYGEDKEITVQFGEMFKRIKGLNEAPDRVLMDFAVSSGVEDIRNFMEIYCICIKSGGDKEKAIAKAAVIIGEKISLRREINTLLSQKKLEAGILCSIPLAVLLFLQVTSSDYGGVLYTTLAGRIVMTLCLAVSCWAAVLCFRIMDLKI